MDVSGAFASAGMWFLALWVTVGLSTAFVMGRRGHDLVAMEAHKLFRRAV